MANKMWHRGRRSVRERTLNPNRKGLSTSSSAPDLGFPWVSSRISPASDMGFVSPAPEPGSPWVSCGFRDATHEQLGQDEPKGVPDREQN